MTTVGLGDLPRSRDGSAVRLAVDRAGAGRNSLWPAASCGMHRCFWCSTSRPRLRTPETERALFARYAEASYASTVGGITLLVSHRFSTVRMVDLIVVLDGSRLAEVGTREELVAAGGPYAELRDPGRRLPLIGSLTRDDAATRTAAVGPCGGPASPPGHGTAGA